MIRTERYIIDTNHGVGSKIVLPPRKDEQSRVPEPKKIFDGVILSTKSVGYYVQERRERHLQESSKRYIIQDPKGLDELDFKLFPNVPILENKKGWLRRNPDAIFDDYVYIIPRD